MNVWLSSYLVPAKDGKPKSLNKPLCEHKLFDSFNAHRRGFAWRARRAWRMPSSHLHLPRLCVTCAPRVTGAISTPPYSPDAKSLDE